MNHEDHKICFDGLCHNVRHGCCEIKHVLNTLVMLNKADKLAVEISLKKIEAALHAYHIKVFGYKCSNGKSKT